jgi:hypothetical protein
MSSKRNALLAAIAACLTLAVVASSASAAPVLTDPTGTTMGTGTSIVGTNVGDVKFTTPLEVITCSNVILGGKVTTNSTASGSKIEITSAAFSGTGAAGECTSGSSGNVTVTSSPATNGLPWCRESTAANDEVRLRGGGCGSLARPIRIVMDFTSALIGACVYQRSAATVGTVRTHIGAEETFSEAITEQEWTKTEGSGFCGGSFKLDASFLLETAGGQRIYISS